MRAPCCAGTKGQGGGVQALHQALRCSATYCASVCTDSRCRSISDGGILTPNSFSMASATSTARSEEHTSELQSPCNLVCRLLLEKKKHNNTDKKNTIVVSRLLC